jgi:ribosomal protein L23
MTKLKHSLWEILSLIKFRTNTKILTIKGKCKLNVKEGNFFDLLAENSLTKNEIKYAMETFFNIIVTDIFIVKPCLKNYPNYKKIFIKINSINY